MTSRNKELRRRKNTWMIFTVLLFVATVFLLTLNSISEIRIGKLQKRISILEFVLATTEKEETKLFLPDGKGDYKEFEIIRRF